MVLTGDLSGVARTAGVLLTGVALTLISLMTSDQMTSILTSALATGYGNLRDEEDPYHKKRSGDEGALDLPSHLITGNSTRGMAGEQPEAPQGHGKAADLEMTASPGILMTRDFEGAGKRALEEVLPRDTKAALLREEGTTFLVLMTLVQKRVLMLLMKQPEDEISVVEAVAPLEGDPGSAYSPLLMSFLALKEDGSQTPGMEIESPDQVMNTFGMLPDLIIPLTMAIRQLAESAPLLSKAWTWPLYHPGSAPGMMGRARLNTERWTPKEAPRRTEEAKAEGAQDLPRECQNPAVPALWMETIMTDTTEMNLLVALQAAAHPLEGPGVAVTGVEGVT